MTVDQNIIKGCVAGKRRAQSKLYKKFAPVMMGVCLRYCRHTGEAEDVLQEGFIKVFKNIKGLNNPGALQSWIRSIMVNTAISHLKKNKIRFEEFNADQLEMGEEENETYTYKGIDPDKLLNIIHTMPEGYRTVLNLYVFEGLIHKEIAALLGISENTSKSQLSKARRYLKTILAQDDLVNKKPVTDEKRI